jgi:hypothetical protein
MVNVRLRIETDAFLACGEVFAATEYATVPLPAP